MGGIGQLSAISTCDCGGMGGIGQLSAINICDCGGIGGIGPLSAINVCDCGGMGGIGQLSATNVGGIGGMGQLSALVGWLLNRELTWGPTGCNISAARTPTNSRTARRFIGMTPPRSREFGGEPREEDVAAGKVQKTEQAGLWKRSSPSNKTGG